MGNRLNVHQMKCIRKIPVSEGGTDKHTNIAFISEENFRNYQNNEEIQYGRQAKTEIQPIA